jgi:hypothetical protein
MVGINTPQLRIIRRLGAAQRNPTLILSTLILLFGLSEQYCGGAYSFLKCPTSRDTIEWYR